jgi:hypothetical protein
VRRWTSEAPTPSLGTLTASSWTITATANMPKALGGMSRARTTMEPNMSSSQDTRATLVQRSPLTDAPVSSSLVWTSLNALGPGVRSGSPPSNVQAAIALPRPGDQVQRCRRSVLATR